ncbi:ParB/RepB/Spo0J family partition protein [Oscillatoria sp. FACHB-1407]|uniref:ParB/RepB/Spo0J family partition protein n=1 Tax=Oscillatoria sp. FACHB-1407 TaxID=2692847 RepID=UPI001688066F|nr:ParB/RepB/Spo0J family partition protein [Oscillatoria sp. FACHB-1407]MBD2465229.1 ParB/RepB/Spo0J family partition protein [Oscillatoria sp. FACHB-1407]
MKPSGNIDESNSANHSPIIVSVRQIYLPAIQPRRYFNSQSNQRLIQSIKTHGILQPLLVRPRAVGGYELVAGERRYRAAIAAELERVPVLIRELTDAEAAEIGLMENLLREDLNPLEETEGILHLLAMRLNRSIEEIPRLLHQLQHQYKKRIGETSKHSLEQEEHHGDNQDSLTLITVEAVFASLQRMSWVSFVNNRLPLLNLPGDILGALRLGRIEYTKAKVIAQLKNVEQRQQLLEQAIAHNWSLNRIKEEVKALQLQTSTVSLKQRVDRAYRQLKQVKPWEHPQKQNKLETLLTELETLLQDE